MSLFLLDSWFSAKVQAVPLIFFSELTRIGGDGSLLEIPVHDGEDVFLVPGQHADIMFVPKGKPGSELIVYWKDSARGRHTIDIMDNAW